MSGDVLSKPLGEISPLIQEVLECPVEFNARLRAEAPAHKCPQTGILFVSDYEAITAIARDHGTFSNKFGLAMRSGEDVDPRLIEVQKEGYPAVDTMLTQDPPLHRRYRGLVNQAFTFRRVTELDGHIEEVCNHLIDGFIDDGECEFVEAFSERVPMIVIAEQLGVPLSDYDRFKTWSDAFVAQLSQMASPDEELAAAKLILQFQKYFAAKLEERRQKPKNDIISDIVHAKFENERSLDTAEMLSILQQLLVAGNETTTHAISEGMLLLIRNPHQLEKMQADPDLIPSMVEEVLRLTTPTANMWRVVVKDTEVHGMEVPAGTMVQIRFASANRDEQVFTDPDKFDVERENVKSNIAFGHGVHMCVGANLARKELEVAFRVLLKRLDKLELNCTDEELFYPPNVLLRGLQKLPIRFTARAAA